jgi:EpsI family protein
MARLTDISNKSLMISICLLTFTFVFSLLISLRGKPVVVQTNLEKLPMVINGMHGTEDSFSDAVYKELNADKNIYRHYHSADGKQVDLYIGYYGTAKGGRTGHNPGACLPSQGWGGINLGQVILKSNYYPEGVPVACLISTKDDFVLTTISWYQSDGNKVLSNGLTQNIQRFMGMIFHNRNDGAFVRITYLSNQDDVAAAKVIAQTFAEQILHLLPNYWPVEK